MGTLLISKTREEYADVRAECKVMIECPEDAAKSLTEAVEGAEEDLEAEDASAF